MKAITNNSDNGEEIKPIPIYSLDGSPSVWIAKELEKEVWTQIPHNAITLIFNKGDSDVPWKEVSDFDKISFIPTEEDEGFLILPHDLKLLINLDLEETAFYLQLNFDASLASAIATAFLNVPPKRILGSILSKIKLIISKPLSETNLLTEFKVGETIPASKIPGVDLKFSLMGLKLKEIKILDQPIDSLITPEGKDFITTTGIKQKDIEEVKVEKPLFSQGQSVAEKKIPVKEEAAVVSTETPVTEKAPDTPMERSIPSPAPPPPPPNKGLTPPPPPMSKAPAPKTPSVVDERARTVPTSPAVAPSGPTSPPSPKPPSPKSPAPSPPSPQSSPPPPPSAMSAPVQPSPPSQPAPTVEARSEPPSRKKSAKKKRETKSSDDDLSLLDDDLDSFIEELDAEEEIVEDAKSIEETRLFPGDIEQRDYRPMSEKSLKIDWYDRMILQRTYPVTIKISEQKFEKKKSVTSLVSGERISEITETIEVEEEKPIVIKPQFPGSLVVPSERVIAPGTKEATVQFFVTPLSKGWMEAHIEFVQGVKVIDDIRLKSKVIDHRLAKVAAISGSIVSAIPATFAFLFNLSLTQFFEERIHGVDGSLMVAIQLILTFILFGSGIGLYQWSNFRSYQHKTFTG